MNQIMTRRIITFSLIPVAVCAVVLAGYLARYDFNPAVLSAAPAAWADCIGDLPADMVVREYGGSDGSLNYVSARDPFLRRSYPECARVAVAYTTERWLYQISSWLLAFGSEKGLLYSMPLVNLIAVFFSAFFTALILQHRGMDLRWTLLATLHPGIWQPLRFNLVDLVFVASVMGALYFYERRKLWPTVGMIALLMMGRGIGIGVVLVLIVLAVVDRRDFKAVGAYVLGTLPFYAVLKPWLKSALEFQMGPFGMGPFGGVGNLRIPFARPLQDLAGYIRTADWQAVILITATLAFYALGVVMVCRRMWQDRKFRYEGLLLIGFALAIVSLNGAAWRSGPIQMFRMVGFIFPCVVFLFAARKDWASRILIWSIPLLSVIGPIWMWTARIQR